ncbi:MAG: general secretion pathway protein GspK [Candidatus Omnitrophica bacterium]|nr:general secretion pathway protein GspK [Candidatus Omnitrophota bacterium]
MHKRNYNKLGSIFILTLVMIVFLSSLLLAISYGIRQKVAFVNRIEQNRRLSSLAELAVSKVISYLKKQNPKKYIALTNDLINNPLDFKDIDFGKDYISLSYNFFDDASKEYFTFYGLIDEARKININKADFSVLMRLFLLVNLEPSKSEEIASSIIDWRDPDNLLYKANSAEDSYYRFLELPYEAKDGDFERLEELILLKGMSPDIFLKVKDYLTVYGDGKININTASKIVLLALGLTESLVDKIIFLRAGKDGISGTDDDCIFFDPNEIVSKLTNLAELNKKELEELDKFKDNFTVNSNFFSVKATATQKGSKIRLNVDTVIDYQGKIYLWNEN